MHLRHTYHLSEYAYLQKQDHLSAGARTYDLGVTCQYGPSECSARHTIWVNAYYTMLLRNTIPTVHMRETSHLGIRATAPRRDHQATRASVPVQEHQGNRATVPRQEDQGNCATFAQTGGSG